MNKYNFKRYAFDATEKNGHFLVSVTDKETNISEEIHELDGADMFTNKPLDIDNIVDSYKSFLVIKFLILTDAEEADRSIMDIFNDIIINN